MSDTPGEGGGPIGPVAQVGEAEEVVSVRIKVNGVTIEVTQEVVIKDILTKAKEAACFGGAVAEYVLQRVSEDDDLPLEQTIIVIESEEFIAVPSGPTPVA